MKIYTKVFLIILLISIAHIESSHSSFRASFGLRKKSNTRNQNSLTSRAKNSISTTKAKARNLPTKFFAVSTSITKEKTVSTTSGSTTTSTTRGGDIPDFNIYFDGWVKYLRFTDTKVQKPKAFFKNTKYASESRAKPPSQQNDNVIF
jgi:hypothetical protein